MTAGRGIGDRLLGGSAHLAALAVLILLGGIIVMLAVGAWPAFEKFGFIGFITTAEWNPVT